MSLEARWQACVKDVASICERCGRDPSSVKIVAVSKTVEAPVVAQAIELGIRDFGENRDKAFCEKYACYPQAHWHFIGQLQSRKAKHVVGKACLIHSLDRPHLLAAIQKAAAAAGIVQNVLVEVSVSGEQSKAGVDLSHLDELMGLIASCPNVACLGLMTMAPRGNRELARKTFRGLSDIASELADTYRSRDNISMKHLSMGMTEDYDLAIEQGATIVRIGRKIFSDTFDLD